MSPLRNTSSRRDISSQVQFQSYLQRAAFAWGHHQQREDSHTAARKKWLRSSRHHLGQLDSRDSNWTPDHEQNHIFDHRLLRSLNETWECNVWKKKWWWILLYHASSIDFGGSHIPLFVLPPDVYDSGRPHFSSYSPLSTWRGSSMVNDFWFPIETDQTLDCRLSYLPHTGHHLEI